ncbi:SIR2 family protein [Paenibacillus polymyxa]|uniref:SIR2 family protein n=1 Tax=Paenibacillus polymyxa TaxID=1406 RepID=A0AAP3ZWK7_PAEPO|nr:SIR2 family protein [Paenibacillus polymyxa]MDH2331032.1 SIR2 family protein [Paenibacillus polymyxa]
MNQANDIKKLVSVLNEDGTVLFIGSGISVWSGLPTWYGLVKELANYVKEEGLTYENILQEASVNLLNAAGLGQRQLSSQQFKVFIRQACRVGMAKPSVIHEKIVKLGIRNFITTNYDKLLEEALRLYKNNYTFQVVTNRQPTDCASIVQIRARDFIFKPHGDIDDTDSIVLSHEQYRSLYGEKNHTIRTLETLLLTRPVIFIGYSLTDADFIYIKDNLENIFKGRAPHHYAIMADVSEDKRRYLLDVLGIRIISYQTLEGLNGYRDHTPLLELLDKLSLPINPQSTEIQENVIKLNDSQVMSLLRYAAGLTFHIKYTSNIEFPINVTYGNGFNKTKGVQKLLEESSDQIVLIIGSPGAGKTYSFKKFCNNLAQRLKDDCISELYKESKLQVPIYLDLKLYNGSILDMAENLIPANITLEELIESTNCVFILDSYNEMPKKFFENGQYEKDLSGFFEKIKDSRVIVGSRTNEGIKINGITEYIMEEIPYSYVMNYFKEIGIRVNGRLSSDIVRILQRPFFFKLLLEKKVVIESSTSPNSMFQSFFEIVKSEINHKYGIAIELPLVLKSIAFSAINEGMEAISLQEVMAKLKVSLRVLNKNDQFSADKVLQILVDQEILIPLPGNKLSFFHQSITEYLAAMELSNIYRFSPETLESCLVNTRWDQTLFLTIGFLSPDDSAKYMKQVLEKDLTLAIRASKYLECDNETLVSIILNFIIENLQNIKHLTHSFEHVLIGMPVTHIHEKQLRILMNKGNLLGASSAGMLQEIKGEKFNSELITLIIENKSDYNFVTELGRLLAKRATWEDAFFLFTKLKEIRISDYDGLAEAVAEVLSIFDINRIKEIVVHIEELSELEAEIYSRYLGKLATEDSVKELIILIQLGYKEAIFQLYMKIDSVDFDTKLLNDNLINAVLTLIERDSDISFSTALLEKVCKIQPSLKLYLMWLKTSAKSHIKLIMLYILRDELEDEFWTEYSNYISDSENNFAVIGQFTAMDWSNREYVFRNIISDKNVEVFYFFLESVRHNKHFSHNLTHADLHSLIEWHVSIEKKGKDQYWLTYLTKEFILNKSDRNLQNILLNLFNQKDGRYRDFLENVIYRLSFVTTDMLSEDALNYCINMLSVKQYPLFDRNLGGISTEEFVNHHIVPLLSTGKGLLRNNLKEVLKQAGQLHRKRYLDNNL